MQNGSIETADSNRSAKDGSGNESKSKKEDVPKELPIRMVYPGEMKSSMNDIGGYEEAKLEVIEYINFINHGERYRKLGARMPKGALLVGPPGTGKTLLARATAGEANIPFIACSSASLLVHTDGAEKLREIFKFALDKAPCVLYFDEIDCIGLARSDQRRSTKESRALTEELLVQLDGFQQTGDKLLLVLASTNHQKDLDEALTRPGRFDRIIEMPAPDLPTRMSILRVHLQPLTTRLDKDFVAKRFGILTAGLTGAQIAALCNESAMIAAREMSDDIDMPHLEAALDRIRSGIKKRKQLADSEKLKAAYHDSAHAVIGWFLEGASPPTKISLLTMLGILPNTAGEIECSQVKIDGLGRMTKSEAMHTLAVVMAGAASEEFIYGSYGANCDHDFEIASKLALKMVAECGMCEDVGKIHMKTGFRFWACGEKFKFGPKTSDMIFENVKAILDEAYKLAKTVLAEHKKQLEEVAQLLMKKNLLTLDMLVDVLGPSPHADIEKLRLDDADFLPAGMKQWNKCEDDDDC